MELPTVHRFTDSPQNKQKYLYVRRVLTYVYKYWLMQKNWNIGKAIIDIRLHPQSGVAFYGAFLECLFLVICLKLIFSKLCTFFR